MRAPIQLQESNTSSGLSNIIGLLLLIIHYLLSRLMEQRQELELLSKEILELKVKLNRTSRVFAPKNEQTSEGEKSDPKKPKRKSRRLIESLTRREAPSRAVSKDQGIYPKTFRKKRSFLILKRFPAAKNAKRPMNAFLLLIKSPII